MSDSRFIRNEYTFQIANDKCMCQIERDDSKYTHNVVIMFSIVAERLLKFELAIETNNKTNLQYTSEEDFEKMHHGLIKSIREKFRESKG